MRTARATEREPAWGAPARRGLVVLLVTGFLVRALLRGIPLDAPTVYTWVSGALVVGCVGRTGAWIRRSLREWVPFVVLIVAYQFGYGLAGRFHKTGDFPVEGDRNVIGMPLHVSWPIDVDRHLFGGILPTTWIQEHAHHGIPVFAFAVTLVYFSHFFVAPAAALVLWWRGSPLFRPWLRMVLTLAGLGLTGYFLYPMAPPWLASQQGAITPEVQRYIGEGWTQLHLGIARGLLGETTAMSNPVAAMPSLHVATATLVALVLPWRSRPIFRVLMLAYPAAMAFTLVYGGEHYVIDELCGAVLACGIVVGWRLLARHRARRGTAHERRATAVSPERPEPVESSAR